MFCAGWGAAQHGAVTWPTRGMGPAGSGKKVCSACYHWTWGFAVLRSAGTRLLPQFAGFVTSASMPFRVTHSPALARGRPWSGGGSRLETQSLGLPCWGLLPGLPWVLFRVRPVVYKQRAGVCWAVGRRCPGSGGSPKGSRPRAGHAQVGFLTLRSAGAPAHLPSLREHSEPAWCWSLAPSGVPLAIGDCCPRGPGRYPHKG